MDTQVLSVLHRVKGDDQDSATTSFWCQSMSKWPGVTQGHGPKAGLHCCGTAVEHQACQGRSALSRVMSFSLHEAPRVWALPHHLWVGKEVQLRPILSIVLQACEFHPFLPSWSQSWPLNVASQLGCYKKERLWGTQSSLRGHTSKDQVIRWLSSHFYVFGKNRLFKLFLMPLILNIGLPHGSAGKESICNAGDLGSIPGLGRPPGEGKGYPFQFSGLGWTGRVYRSCGKPWLQGSRSANSSPCLSLSLPGTVTSIFLPLAVSSHTLPAKKQGRKE